MAFELMLGRHPCLPARHAVHFTVRVKMPHRMNPLNAIASMFLQKPAAGHIAQCTCPDIRCRHDVIHG